MSAAASDGNASGPTELERLRRDYAFAFLNHRVERTEPRLLAAYELGRRAMAGGLGLLELSELHHRVVAEALLGARDAAAQQEVVQAASAFFVEVLSTFEMAQRGFAELRRSASDDPA